MKFKRRFMCIQCLTKGVHCRDEYAPLKNAKFESLGLGNPDHVTAQKLLQAFHDTVVENMMVDGDTKMVLLDSLNPSHQALAHVVGRIPAR
jgi:hypothetical protein